MRAPAVILVRPQMPENVGAAARAMLNFGATDLRLIEPDFGWPNAKAVASASGAHEVMNKVRFFKTVGEACFDIHRLYATTARTREMDKPVIGPIAAAREIVAHDANGEQSALLFGPERTGLDNDEIVLADAILTVDLNPEFSSLNLAQAVLLSIYQWHALASAASETVPVSQSLPKEPPAAKAELQGMLDHLFAELDDAGFFRSDTRRKSLIRTVSVMFERRQLTQPEVHLMRGMIKELRHGPFDRRPKQ